MKTREEYDNIINQIKDKLGDNFANISDIIADLSTDYDSVIQSDLDYKSQIENLKGEKVKLLETNNNLFTQITNTKKEEIDKNQLNNPNDNNTNQSNEVPKIDSIISDTGDLE